MARLHLHPDRLEIALTPAEKLLALRKSDVVVPREAIRSATITDDPWIWVRGIRAPGTAIPLNLAVGQWKFHGGKDFLVIKGTRQAVVIDVDGEEFSRVIVTTTHAQDLVGALRIEDRAPKKPRARVAKPRQFPGSRKAAASKDADAPVAGKGTAKPAGSGKDGVPAVVTVVPPETQSDAPSTTSTAATSKRSGASKGGEGAKAATPEPAESKAAARKPGEPKAAASKTAASKTAASTAAASKTAASKTDASTAATSKATARKPAERKTSARNAKPASTGATDGKATRVSASTEDPAPEASRAADTTSSRKPSAKASAPKPVSSKVETSRAANPKPPRPTD